METRGYSAAQQEFTSNKAIEGERANIAVDMKIDFAVAEKSSQFRDALMTGSVEEIVFAPPPMALSGSHLFKIFCNAFNCIGLAR